MIEENAQSGNLGQPQAFCCMVENGPHLLDGDAREPLDKLSDLDPILQILKESRDRDARATKHPRATYALRVTLDH